MKKKLLIIAIAISALAAIPTHLKGAVTVTESTSGTLPIAEDVFFGQSFTIPSGEAYQNIRFSWLGTDGASTVAFGDLFLIDQEYLGTPHDLSSSTTGFVGQSTGISAGEYLFASNLTLNAGSSYWAYTAGTPSILGIGASISNPYAGGVQYVASPIEPPVYGDYHQNAPTLLDMNFKVSSVPEPSSTVLLGLGSLALMSRRRR